MDHRYLSRWLACAMLSLSCVECGEREPLQEKTTGGFPEDHVIRVSTEVVPATKGYHITDNITEFDLMVTDNTNANPKYSFANTRFSKFASGEWIPDETRLWGGAGDKVDICAVAPCFSERDKWKINSFFRQDSDYMCEIESNQSEGSKNSDYLSFTVSANVKDCLTDGKLKIQFVHMLSLVRVTFKLGTEFNNTGVPQSNIISDVVISGTNRSFLMKAGTNEDKLTAMNNTEATASDVKPYYTEWHSAADKNGSCTSVYECILVPQSVAAGGLKISFKADGKAYEWIASNDLTFFQNTVHSLTLKVGKDVVLAGGFTTDAWTETDGGKLETE